MSKTILNKIRPRAYQKGFAAIDLAALRLQGLLNLFSDARDPTND